MFPFIEIIKDGIPQPASAVYEVSSDGEQLGYMTIPWLSGNPVKDAPTRGFAVSGIIMESDVSFSETNPESNDTLPFIPSDAPPDSNLTGVNFYNSTIHDDALDANQNIDLDQTTDDSTGEESSGENIVADPSDDGMVAPSYTDDSVFSAPSETAGATTDDELAVSSDPDDVVSPEPQPFAGSMTHSDAQTDDTLNAAVSSEKSTKVAEKIRHQKILKSGASIRKILR